VWENVPFHSLSSTGMHIIKRLMVDYDTPRQYLNFIRTDFWNFSSFGVTWLLSVMRSRLAVQYGAYLLLLLIHVLANKSPVLLCILLFYFLCSGGCVLQRESSWTRACQDLASKTLHRATGNIATMLWCHVPTLTTVTT